MTAKRIYILGTSGSGKSTLAKKISKHYRIAHLELDSIYHQANWTPLPESELRERVSEFCSGNSWVIDGNYSMVRDLILARATHVVMLDYRRVTVMWRLLRRTFRRVVFRQELWNGNREELKFVFSRDREENILLWAWTTHDKRRRDFEEITEGLSRGINLHRLKSPSELNQLFADLG